MAHPRDRVAQSLDVLRLDLLHVSLRDRWDRLFAALAWLHLGLSALSQWLYLQPWHRSWQHVTIWVVETALVLLILRQLAGRRWFDRSPLAGVLMRIWATYFLVAFGAATLNSRTGFGVDWFKLSWASLSSFAWAATAAILGWRFLIFAFLMYFSALLMTRFPSQGYLILGVSWFLALQVLAYYLRRLRKSPGTGPPAGRRRDQRVVHHLRAS